MKNFFKNIAVTIIGVFIALLLFVMIVPAVVMTVTKMAQDREGAIQEKSILHVKVKGPFEEYARPFDFDIFAGGSPFSQDNRALPLFETIAGIDAAKDDKRIQGLYLEIRHFEAGWAGVSELHRAIKSFAEAGKFVYAYGDSFDEKSYYLATAAEKIFMAPAGELELNGLSVSSTFLKGLLEKLDVQPRIFRVGKFKAAVEPLIANKMSEENRLQNKTLVDDIWGIARKEISRFAGEKPDSIDEAAGDLRIRSAENAADNGFITELSYEDQVEDLMKEKTVGKEEELRLVHPIHLLHEDRAVGESADKKIAIVFAEGEITSGSGTRDSVGSEGIVADLQEAAEDENVKAIVVRVNSPGGDALASDVIWRKIKKIDETIPVIVSFGDVAASGGYYMSAGARYIVAEATTITGSIGVFGVLFDTEKFFRGKLGVEFDQVGTHPYADIGNFNREMTELEKQVIQESVTRVYGRFLTVVREGREFKDANKVEELAEGRIWSGLRAKELGLVDELGGLSLAIEKAAQLGSVSKPYPIEVFPRNDDPISILLERFAVESRVILPEWLLKLSAHAGEYAKTLDVKPGAYARMLYDLEIR